MTPSGVVVG